MDKQLDPIVRETIEEYEANLSPQWKRVYALARQFALERLPPIQLGSSCLNLDAKGCDNQQNHESGLTK